MSNRAVIERRAGDGQNTTGTRSEMEAGLPRWVEDEIRNWARAQWEGDWPGPRRMEQDAPDLCEFPPQPGHDDDDEPVRIPVNHERARRVNALYEALPLVERRVVQAEYTRRADYGDLPGHLRQGTACRVIGITLPYYKVALGSFKQQVWRTFK
ncbi:hypothetical protein [Achromobacter sp.]|uniref:hypothetical protein n=1 Tax=Achromobacter sp. TaxID=134375 RepID=UPI0028AF166F|nr:hypothetical protein [Achromobacter sp.]